MNHESLRTVRQVAESSPAFSEASLRWMIFNAERNGFDQAIFKVGGRVLIDIVRFAEWLESHRLNSDS